MNTDGITPQEFIDRFTLYGPNYHQQDCEYLFEYLFDGLRIPPPEDVFDRDTSDRGPRFRDKETADICRKQEYDNYVMGYRGNSYIDAGYFYCPYVPLVSTPVVFDPKSFAKKGILTRYGAKLLREGAKFYEKLQVTDYVI